jgi:bacterioferritin-associated ferredoxin
MYVCICHQVTERAVRAAAQEGVTSLRELTHRTGCAGGCGCCAELALEVLRDEVERCTAGATWSAAA